MRGLPLNAERADGESGGLAWLAVGILLAAYAVSLLDRQVVSLLVEPLKHDLGITDTQIGILQGPAFGLFYAVLGLPLGWLADRMNRVHLIAAAVLMWSVMTCAGGLAQDFGGLLAARLGVGIGEAALVPAAISLLSDLFGPGRRALPLSVFTSGISLGTGLALVLGGAFIAYAAHGVAGLPVLGAWLATRHPWQAVFILCGLVGLPVAAAVLLLRDPRALLAEESRARGSARLALRLLRTQRAFFLPMLASMAGFYVLSSALLAWMPSLFIRRFAWTPVQVGHTVGLGIMACSLIGNWSSGGLTHWLAARGYRDATLRTMLTGTTLMLPLALLTPLLPVAGATLPGMMLLYFTIALTFGVATTAFVEVTPPQLRGQVVALYLLIGNLVGLGLGPPSVGKLMDLGPGPFHQIGPALALVCVTVAVPSLALLYRARSRFVQALVS